MSKNLDECFQQLHRPKIDQTPSLKCYQAIRFSDEKAPGKLEKSMRYYEVLSQLMGAKVSLLDIKLDAYLDGKLFVPDNLEEMVKKASSRMVLIPVETESNNYYGLVYDRQRKNLEVFRLPGSRLDRQLYDAEKKMVSLFEQKYQLPVLQFYQAVRHEPREGTRDHETWPAWLVYKRLQKPNQDREIIANYAMEDIVKGSKEYMNFLKAFYG